MEETIGDRVRKAREATGLSARALSLKLSMANSSIAIIEQGKRKPVRRTLEAISEGLGVRMEWLETGEGEMYIPEKSSEKEDILRQLKERFSLNDDSIEMIMAFVDLRSDQQEAVVQFAKNAARRLRVIHDEEEPETPEERRARLHRELDERLDREEKGEEKSKTSTSG